MPITKDKILEWRGVTDELVLTTITCGSIPGADPYFDIHNSGLYYSPWAKK